MCYLTIMEQLTTRLSSKGQVVIPSQLRKSLGLSAGDTLRVEIGPPGSPSIILRQAGHAELDAMLKKTGAWFAKHGIDPVEELHRERRRQRRLEHDREVARARQRRS